MASIIVRETSGNSRVLKSKAFEYEAILQQNIADLPSLVGLETVTDRTVRHLTIGFEWPAGGGSADIVLVGSDGILTIVETKLRRNPQARREVIAQLLEYAAYLSDWTIYEIHRKSEDFFKGGKCPPEYANKTFDDAIGVFLLDSDVDDSVHSFKGKIEDNLRQGHVRLIVAVDEVGKEAQKIVTFVNSHSSFEIYLLQVSAFDHSGLDIFVPTLYGYAGKVRTSSDQSPWDDERAISLVSRLESVAIGWRPVRRVYDDWIDVACMGTDEVFGAQLFKKTGVNLYFWLDRNPLQDLPPGISPRQTKDYLYLSGDLESLSDDHLRRLCEAALRHAEVDLEPAL